MAIKIYIDQGHNPSGTFNTGAEGNGYFEQNITYTVGKRLAADLEQNGNFTVKLSRPTSETVLGTDNSSSLVARVRQANAFGADLFLSLHTNASENPSVSGTEALTYGPGARVANAVAEDILAKLRQSTGLRNRGIVYRPGLYVLRKTVMPAVLVELGFITNLYDAELMVYAPEKFSTGIYRGLLQHYNLS